MVNSSMTKEKWKDLGSRALFWMVPAYLLSEGIANISHIGIMSVLPIASAVVIGYIGSLYNKSDELDEDSEEMSALKESIEIYEKALDEQVIVIKDYEDIFDSQLVELPCSCGGNTFKGLFSPNLENLVTCEKCSNNYRVVVNYDAVLISEPLDQKEL